MVLRWRSLLVAVAFLPAPGCITYEPAIRPRPATVHLEVRHQERGTCRVTEFDEDTWYVLQDNQLVILDPADGHELSRVTLGRPGETGPAVSMVVQPTAILVVLQDAEVVVLDRTDPRRVFIERRYPASDLGLLPRGLVDTEDGVVVMGPGGAVRLPTMARLVDHEGALRAWVKHADGDLYVVDRRAYRAADDEYVGAASVLAPLTDESAVGVAVPEGAMLFWRNHPRGGLAGFAVMEDGILREVDVDDSTIAVAGTIRRVRLRNDRLLVAGSRGLHVYRLDSGGTLRNLWSRDLPGCWDADFVDDRDVVAVGEFGQVRLRTDRIREDELVRRETPGGLIQAVSDGRRIFAMGVDGTWEYQIGDTASVVDPQDWVYPDPPRTAAVLGWEIKLLDDGRQAAISNRIGTALLPAPVNSRFRTVVGGDGAFWLGHETGIVMVKPPRESPVLPANWDTLTEAERRASGRSPIEGIQKLSVSLDGPVIFIQPLALGGGVAYAAAHGGFGVVREIF